MRQSTSDHLFICSVVRGDVYSSLSLGVEPFQVSHQRRFPDDSTLDQGGHSSLIRPHYLYLNGLLGGDDCDCPSFLPPQHSLRIGVLRRMKTDIVRIYDRRDRTLCPPVLVEVLVI